MSDRYEIVLTCPKGLEGLLLEEARALGLEEAREQTAAVRGQAELEVAYRLCLWSRLANRVLLVLSRFSMNNAEELYEGVKAVDWRDHLEPAGSLAVEFSGHGSGIDNSHFGALKVKDAIVDRLRTAGGERPSIDKINPDLRVHLRLDRGEAVLSLDLSGHSLHQRGYRLQQGAAPLKENLAAAVLIRAGWPRIAAEGGALADPMCGVGTFLIEAALMAADVAPNLKRERWGFSNWLGHVPAIWKKLHAEAEQRAAAGLARPPLWIRGYEADPRLIQPGRNNVERAGLSDWVKIYQGELGSFEPRPDQNQKGLVISNPPYGERLGDEASLLYLYQNLGERLRQACLGWEAAVFTGAPELGKRMGLRSHKQYSFWNGALACKLLLIKVQTEQFVTGERRTRTEDEPVAEASSQARLSEGGRCSPTACRRTSSNWASGRAARGWSAIACTMPTCPSTPWRWTFTATGCTCRNMQRRARSIRTRRRRVCSMPWPRSPRRWVWRRAEWRSSAASARPAPSSTSARLPRASSWR